jgi:uncharacterized protein YjbI with pentapeptide repeats
MADRRQCQATDGVRRQNPAMDSSEHCLLHTETGSSPSHNLDDSAVTLSETDIDSLTTWHENENPHLTPIGFRCLTRKDIELAVHAWRQANGEPQLPVRDFWQRDGKWRQGPNLAGLDFSGRDLRQMDLSGIIFSYANLQAATLRHACMVGGWLWRTNLHRADVRQTDLSGTKFFEADLTEAEFWRANLCGASFRGANMERTRLLGANLDGVYFHRARLNNAEMVASQLGGSIGEERDHNYSPAIEAYARLKANFESLGRYSDAGWAYRRERRMRKLWAAQQAWDAWRTSRRCQAIKQWSKWAGDWLVELLCDYGESTWRVIGWIAAMIFVVGPTMVSVAGGLSWTSINRYIYFKLPTVWQRWAYAYFQYLLYVLDVFTTASFSELEPSNDAVRLVSGFMAMSGIFLAGLLGFVAGNRIRNS